MIKRFSIALICLAVLAMSFVLIQNWNIAPSNTVTFKITAMVGNVNGSIGGLKGTVSFDPQDLKGSNLDVSLDVSSIKTGNGKRDKDIMAETWFNTTQYPTITFKSNGISKTTSGYNVDGTLTIKGVAKKAQIPFTFAQSPDGGTFTGTLHLNRLDYGVGKETKMVGNDVDVVITVPVKK